MESPDPGLLEEGSVVSVGGRAMEVVRRAGTDARPLVRLEGVDDRDAAEVLRGAELLSGEGDDDDEGWEAAALVGCEIPGIGTVRRVLWNPSCEVLEAGDAGVLVPLVADAVRRVDTDARVIEVDLRFLGIEDLPEGEERS